MPTTIGNPHDWNLWRKYQQLTLISSFMACDEMVTSISASQCAMINF
ncbi:hypothetical protein [Vibrio brasiliensis]